jgi:hypothetical protein
MLRTYRLVKPVAALQQDIRKVVTIPVDAVVVLVGIKAGLGIQKARWNEHPIMVYEHDLAASSVKLVSQSL